MQDMNDKENYIEMIEELQRQLASLREENAINNGYLQSVLLDSRKKDEELQICRYRLKRFEKRERAYRALISRDFDVVHDLLFQRERSEGVMGDDGDDETGEE